MVRGTLSVNVADKADWQGFINACKAHRSEDLLDGQYSQLVARYPAFADRVFNRYNRGERLDG